MGKAIVTGTNVVTINLEEFSTVNMQWLDAIVHRCKYAMASKCQII